MFKRNINQGIPQKSWLKVGVLLAAVLIGAGGCGTSNNTPAASAAQGQSGQRQLNPALQAVMEIRRLENTQNQQYPLTSDQKDKLKPILQNLINTSNPSQDFLKQQADAINAIFTDQQKSYMTQPRSSNGNNQNGNNNSNGNSPRRNYSQGGNGSGTGGGQGRPGGNGGNFNPQTLYQQVLTSLS